jgi:hypothetical protein
MKRILRAALELGASKPKLMEQIGVGDAILNNPLGHMSGVALLRMLDQLARDLGDPAVALKIGQISGPRSLSDPGYAIR